MKKITITLIACLMVCFSFNSNAQNYLGAGVGIFSFTEGDADPYFGPEFGFKFELNESLRAGVSLGYFFDSEKVELGDESFRATAFAMPILANVDYFLMDGDFKPYAGANIGTYIFGFRYDGDSESEGYFGFAPAVGFEYELSEGLFLNSNFKYNVFFYENWQGETDNQGAISFNIGVIYQL